jgi:hypothetical protein
MLILALLALVSGLVLWVGGQVIVLLLVLMRLWLVGPH